ncbi:MAG: nucleotidyltransferase domain-containing protein [Patescibacteria group bacterium]
MQKGERLINFVVRRLKNLRGIKAVTLGGSWAAKLQRPDSDIDIGLYYKEDNPIDVLALRKKVNEINDRKNPAVSDIGKWGKWVDGGAWLKIKSQRFDLIYRNLDFVSRIIDDCRKGKIQSDYYQQPVFGFHSYIYLGEIRFGRALYDPQGYIKRLKEKVNKYPIPLKRKIINTFLWDAEFTLRYAKGCCRREEIYIEAGSLFRVASDLIQAIYAINRRYFIGDKRLYRDLNKFKKLPKNFIKRANEIFGLAGKDKKSLANSISKIEKLFREVVSLTKGFYKIGEVYKHEI